MRNRYREGYVQGFKKAQADAEIEIGRLQEEISLLARKINDLGQKAVSEEITHRLHKAIAISDLDPGADPVQHPWGGAF